MNTLCIPEGIIQQNKCKKSKHYAVIRQGGKIIATGYNQPGSFKFKGRSYMRHAECMALKNVPKNILNKGTRLDLTVIRQGLSESKPCQHCIDYMRKHKANIRRVSYSSNGLILTEKLNTISNQHVSVHWLIC